MDRKVQKLFVRSALTLARSGTLNLNNDKQMNMYEECSVMAASLEDIDSFCVAHKTIAEVSYKNSRFDKALRSSNILLSIFHRNGQKKCEAIECANLGICYISLGQYDKAVKHYEMSLKIATDIEYKEVEESTYANLGNCYLSLGQYDKAVKHYERSLKMAMENGHKVGEERLYGNLGICYHSLGQYDKAITHHEMNLKIARVIGDKEVEGRSYGDLGNCYLSLGQYDKAVKHHEISLEIATEIGHKEVEGNAYANLGNCCQCLGKYNEAIKHYKMSLKIAKENGHKKLEGSAYGNLGSCYSSLGQYDKAEKQYEMSLKIAKEIGEKAVEGRAYGNLGNCYRSVGKYNKAVTHHEMSLKIATEIGHKEVEATTYGNLGNCYHALGQYDKAVRHYEMNLKIATTIGDKIGEGRANGNLGNCFQSFGQYSKAVKRYETSLKIATEIGHKEAKGTAYGNLGNCYHSLGQYDKAVKSYEISLKIATEIGHKELEGVTYGNLGNCYQFLGQYTKAVKYYEISLKIAREIGLKEVEATAYGNIGNCLNSLGQYDEAVKLYEMSLKIAADIGNKAEEGTQCCNLGSLCYRFKQFENAVCNLKEGLKRFEDLFQTSPQMDEIKVSFRESFCRYYDLLVNVLIEQGQTNEALVLCERGRARALVDLMQLKYFLPGYETEENLLDLAAVYRLVTSLQSTVLYFALTKDYLYIWIIQLNGCIHFKKISLPTQTKDQYSNEIVVSLLEHVNAMISKFRSSCLPIKCEDRSLSLLYLKTEIKQYDEERGPEVCSSRPHPNAEVDESAFAKKCTTESSDKDTLVRNPFPEEEEEDAETSALQKLHQLLLAPVQDHIEGKEVVIVPQGSLHLVPFAALIDEHGHYVAESLRVRIFPSLSTAKMILENESKPNEEMKPLIVGDPDTTHFPRLPCAEKEAQMVAKLFNTEPLIGGEATKEKVLLRIENASLIHIAAHGDMERGEVLLARNPKGSTISTEPKAEDNMLLMTDLEHKRITAKLVVLSCCHSARGSVTADGVVGIARAFLGAGARSVLVALWAINDGATFYFMERFYEHLTQGESAGESLSEAMAAMRTSVKYSNPRHWAPFVLIGDDVNFARCKQTDPWP